MEDWFGETPVVMREFSPSHFDSWRYFCNFCSKESIVEFEGKYLCISHAEETMMEIFDNE